MNTYPNLFHYCKLQEMNVTTDRRFRCRIFVFNIKISVFLPSPDTQATVSLKIFSAFRDFKPCSPVQAY